MRGMYFESLSAIRLSPLRGCLHTYGSVYFVLFDDDLIDQSDTAAVSATTMTDVYRVISKAVQRSYISGGLYA